ncbi:DEAD/DEAH box helicase [uncultured Duncaniella sp.]|uniref:DEAD/DEAH box helicase n=1 Tax=uncultured Duncaniella sp. TaxID=2768039 RepID=UPI0026E5590A|nr:DEAD/DEAH box helicase [uncultured Duncaniella sp.]
MKQTEILANILRRTRIAELNPMQRRMAEIPSRGTFTLLAPTGSGKTIAFAIPFLKSIAPAKGQIQGVVIAPSRELVLQIAEVLRPIATGLKTVAFYGGHSMQEETNSLSVTPDIIVATPGMLLDHLKRGHLDLGTVSSLVLDEYDKALELGFADEMKRVCRRLTGLRLVILTSATPLAAIPEYLPAKDPQTIDFSESDTPRRRMQVVRVESPSRDKLTTLSDLLHSLPNGRVIVFVNHRESAERIYDSLKKEHLPIGLYHGGLDQNDRENAIVQLANGSTPVLISTDLGARGLDIPELSAVVHYHMPTSPEAWTHRNGRTARQEAKGDIYVITAEGEDIPYYVTTDRDYAPSGHSSDPIHSDTATLYFNVGKKEKISRGDIVGFLIAKGGLTASEIGVITLRDHAALVGVPRKKARELLARLSPEKIKNTRAKISLL